MTRAEWLKRRQHGIGASEAAAVLGLHPYASPLSLFYEKTTGQIVEEDSEVQEWGLLLEPAIAKKYEKVTGRAVFSLNDYQIMEMEGRPQFFCTPDRMVVAEGERWPLQLKTSAYFNPKEELPVHWQIQEQHEMMVLGAQGAAFAVLVAGRQFYHVDVKRNDAFIELLLEELEGFWYRMVHHVPPDPDGHRATAEALRRMYPRDRGTVVQLPPQASAWSDELRLVKEQAKVLAERQAALENYLRAAIADHTYGLLEDGSGYSLKTVKRAAYAVEATDYRQLRHIQKLPKGVLA